MEQYTECLYSIIIRSMKETLRMKILCLSSTILHVSDASAATGLWVLSQRKVVWRHVPCEIFHLPPSTCVCSTACAVIQGIPSVWSISVFP